VHTGSQGSCIVRLVRYCVQFIAVEVRLPLLAVFAVVRRTFYWLYWWRWGLGRVLVRRYLPIDRFDIAEARFIAHTVLVRLLFSCKARACFFCGSENSCLTVYVRVLSSSEACIVLAELNVCRTVFFSWHCCCTRTALLRKCTDYWRGVKCFYVDPPRSRPSLFLCCCSGV